MSRRRVCKLLSADLIDTKVVCTAVLAVAAALPPQFEARAAGYTLDDGTTVRLDTTVKFSSGIRTEAPNHQLLGLNTDDGQRAFNRGNLNSLRLDVLSEFDVTHENIGFSASAAGWYDVIYNQGNSNQSPATYNGLGPSNRFTGDTRRVEGREIELLNAYGHGDFHVGGLPLTVRAGQYALQWGESIFSTDSIAYGMAPIDVIKATGVPGSQIKELIRPVPQISFSLQVTPKISVEGYTQFEFVPDRFPGAGSYFELADFLGAGSSRILTGPNPFNPNVPLSLYQGKTEGGRTFGQFGVAAKFHPTTDWDLGLYFVDFDDKSPQIYSSIPTVTVPFAGAVPTAFLPQNIPATAATGAIGTFTQGYARDIRIYGASASTSYGPVNFGFETSLRSNMDLQSTNLSVQPGQSADFAGNSLYARGNTLHFIANALYIGESTGLWDGVTAIAEISGSHLLQITSNKQNYNHAYANTGLEFTGTFDPQYYQVRPALDIDFPITVGWNIQGNEPWNSAQNYSAFYGGFVSIGAAAAYRSVWRAGMQYTHFYGAPDVNQSNGIVETPFLGRDFASFNIQRSF